LLKNIKPDFLLKKYTIFVAILLFISNRILLKNDLYIVKIIYAVTITGMKIRINACRVALLIFLLGPFYLSVAQKINMEKYKAKYPGESKILLQYKTDIAIKPTGDSLTVDITRYEESLYLDENAILQAGQALTYSGYFRISNLTAQTLMPVKSKYKTINVEEFDTSDYREPSIFDDDVKKISFKFPKIQPGAITKLKYTHHLSEPRFLTPVYFNYYLPVESAEVTVTCPSNVTIGYKLINCDSLKLDFSKEQKGSNIIYHWKSLNVPKLNPEPNAPEIAYYASHIFVYVKDYMVNGKQHRILSNTDDLFGWYSTFVNEVNNDAAPTLKTLVDSLVSNVTDNSEKTKKLFYWVQDHIKYIAFEAGREGFVPHSAELVYTRRYGDCKDMASITTKMLQLAGIDSHFVWLGTRHLPYSYSELPLPAVDNHMISAYKDGGDWIFLDATTGPHPFGYPSYMIQGKEALIYLSPTKYEIAKIPEIASEKNLTTDTLFIRLEGKKIIGHGISYFRGYSRFEMYNLIAQEDKSTQTTILKNFFQKGNNKFLIDHFSIVNLFDRDKDLVISYEFNLADYAQVVGNEIFINLNLEKPDEMDLIKTERKTAIESNYKRRIINHVVLDVPQGYKISYLPPNSEFSNDLFRYRIEYKSVPNKVLLTRTLTSDYLLLKNTSFSDWNKMINLLKDAYKESINFTK
jgi:transglutaminase-like putative cysteine protease